MNTRLKITLALASLFAVGTLWGQGARTPEAQLKAAHDKAEFEGDLKGAIEAVAAERMHHYRGEVRSQQVADRKVGR